MVYLTYLLQAINFDPQEFASKSEQKLSRLYLSVVILKPKNENTLAGAYMSQKHPDFSILAARVLALDDLNQAKAWGAPLKKSSADMVSRCRH